uniref:Uncharacterized protein n=1 Tax=Romanomermis culicivorax TaxID=13658 RepID=A0A915IKU8_ROMCU
MSHSERRNVKNKRQKSEDETKDVLSFGVIVKNQCLTTLNDLYIQGLWIVKHKGHSPQECPKLTTCKK